MPKVISFVFFLLITATLHGQIPEDYFQQETNYTINVELNDALHVLSGTVDIEYKNQSGKALSEIYLHLWPNAYKNRSTAFAKQKVENGDTEFYFAKFEQLGGYQDLEIKVDDKVIEWDYWKKQWDIALIKLSSPLETGSSVTINTKFQMKIPETFSRLGHIGQSYQMTQWYPKPAVYDKNGWHPMPYLDQGEFYSEFGRFDVSITLPKNYVVGATGVLQTESEIAFIEQKIKETRKKITGDGIMHKYEAIFPYSDPETKTIRYTAEKVHDFAWFADKRFYVDKGEANLLSGKKVDTYVMFTDVQGDLWSDAIDYVNASVEFYSERIGDYPYPHATAVQSALSAGAGMEYPMITVIGEESSAKSLDEVITHEVGHNWFYGILASNERDHAWMDEGFNSYYEQEYMAKQYKNDDESMLGYDKMAGVSAGESNQIEFYLPMRRHTDQPINTPSQDLRLMNYWIGAYSKPAYLLEYLENYLGQDEFDRIMQAYYEAWSFKHPQPEDVRALFEKESGKDLSWFFEGLINTTKPLDYKMKSVNRVDGITFLTIQNKGEINAPFPVDVVEENKIVKTVWVEGFDGEKTVDIKIGGADKFVIDRKNLMPDFKRSNNTITAKGGKFEPLKLKFLGGIENPRNTTVYWTPVLGGNKYDGFMAGLALYNTVLPSKPFEWSIAPMFGFKSKDITGLANARYHVYPEKVQRITLGVGYKRFSFLQNDFYEKVENASTNFTYQRFRGHIDIELNKKRERSDLKQVISLEWVGLKTDRANDLSSLDTTFFDGGNFILTGYEGHASGMDMMPRLTYRLSNPKAITPYDVKATLEQYSEKTNNAGYAKLSVETKVKFIYKSRKGVQIRAFAGGFLYNKKSDLISQTRGSFSLVRNGDSDYWMDDYYFGRTENSGFASRQIHLAEGGFKTVFNNSFAGVSNKGMLSLNVKLDAPFNFPRFIPNLKPYLDIGYAIAEGEKAYLQFGLALEMLDERIGIYFPIYSTDNIKLNSPSGNYFSKVSFMINLNRLDPNKFLYNFDL